MHAIVTIRDSLERAVNHGLMFIFDLAETFIGLLVIPAFLDDEQLAFDDGRQARQVALKDHVAGACAHDLREVVVVDTVC